MKQKGMMKIFVLFCIAAIVSGCASAKYQSQQVQDNTGDRVTVGKVQREIAVGMASAKVIEVLGSPNVVSTDEERREVWVYDKIATDTVFSHSDAGIKFLTVGTSGAKSTSQRTLTIIIKFDHDNKVRDFAYHSSRF